MHRTISFHWWRSCRVACTELQKYPITPVYSSLNWSKNLWFIWLMFMKILSSSFTSIIEESHPSITACQMGIHVSKSPSSPKVVMNSVIIFFVRVINFWYVSVSFCVQSRMWIIEKSWPSSHCGHLVLIWVACPSQHPALSSSILKWRYGASPHL